MNNNNLINSFINYKNIILSFIIILIINYFFVIKIKFLQYIFNKSLKIFIFIFLLYIQYIISNLIIKKIDNIKHKKKIKFLILKTIIQILKIFSICFYTLLSFSIITNYSINTIITIISTLTAIIILIFRDLILNLISSIQILITKIIKIGDYITLSNEIKGNVKKVNLINVIIENNKKLIYIPTYDLIKKSFIKKKYNKKKIKNFKFIFNLNNKNFINCNKNFLKKLKKIKLLYNFINKKQQKVNKIKNYKFIITNINIYRIYIKKYLIKYPYIYNINNLKIKYKIYNKNNIYLKINFQSNILISYNEIESNIYEHLIIIYKKFKL
ncbi:MAG: mechanosensitive ion channel family protein [Candidatus Shikimatogenerans bostrichidophilus]|nr:MAG: mechanosensitive ion channel family protein [Candidatus Shikimatogenerans bostrichidophilus]